MDLEIVGMEGLQSLALTAELIGLYYSKFSITLYNLINLVYHNL